MGVFLCPVSRHRIGSLRGLAWRLRRFDSFPYSMGSIQDEWASDAVNILAEIPKAVTVRRGSGAATSLNVLMSAPMVEQDLGQGGLVNSTSYDVKFLRSDAVANPNLIIYGNLVHFNGSDYRIVAINDRPPSAWIIVRVMSRAQPA